MLLLLPMMMMMMMMMMMTTVFYTFRVHGSRCERVPPIENHNLHLQVRDWISATRSFQSCFKISPKTLRPEAYAVLTRRWWGHPSHLVIHGTVCWWMCEILFLQKTMVQVENGMSPIILPPPKTNMEPEHDGF